jgi:hypothetical protein
MKQGTAVAIGSTGSHDPEPGIGTCCDLPPGEYLVRTFDDGRVSIAYRAHQSGPFSRWGRAHLVQVEEVD